MSGQKQRRARSGNSFVAGLLCAAGLAVAFGGTASTATAERVGVVEARPATITLRNAQIDARGEVVSLARVARDAEASPHRLVQFSRDLGGVEVATLLTAGVRLGAYVGDGAYYVSLADAEADALEAIDFVSWHGELEASWKVDPGLGERPVTTAERLALRARGEAALHLTAFPGVDVGELGERLRREFGAQVLSSHADPRTPEMSITISRDAVEDLAALDELIWIEEEPELTFRNATTRGIVQGGTQLTTPFYDNGIRGEGQIVGILDSRIAESHCSFNDTDPIGPSHRKIVAYNTSQGVAFHGTHVAGIVAGDGGDNSDTRGVAYKARIAFDTTPSFSESQLVALFEQHRDQGAFVHTNSWGADFRTDYNVWSRAIDRFSWENEDHVVIFAVTNQSSLYTPENAKNVLAVGGTFDTSGVNSHCTGGDGPTIDGRRKPEVYAPGCGIRSANGTDCLTASASGTSMAAPAVAGATALVRQYFADGYYPSGLETASDGFTPTGALLRGMIINSSVDMTNVAGYPSNREGWGRVIADNAAYFAGDARRLMLWENRRSDPEALSEGEVGEHTFFVDGDSEQLRVTLVFTDAPGAAGASPSNIVINNLDLEVETPSGVVYLGNAFAGGESTTGGSADPVNTVEQVHLSAPETGEWTVRVIGSEVSVGPQSYALVVTGEVADFIPTPCPWDLDPNGVVDTTDLAAMLGLWGSPYGATDLAGLLGAWGPCPE